MTESEFREAVHQLVARPVGDLTFEDKAAIVRDAVTPQPVTATASAKLHVLRNVLLCGLGVLTVVGGAAAAARLAWGVPLPYAVLGPALALLGVVGVVILVGWLRGRHSSGPVLLDLGPNPARDSARKAAWAVAVLAVSSGVALGALPNRAALAIILGGSLGLVALFFFLAGRGRLQVRRNGLWVYFSLLRWEEIGSWHWRGGSALWVRTKGFSSWFQRVLPVAPGQQPEVHELLLRNCPAVGPPGHAG